jgi:pimeloyl-ACP methyl ester carboxylesterase
MNTRQTVRDMDLLRALLGEPRISYLGTSAGTWLGAWYATEFPQRVDRFVFDGNVDFTTSWYENQLLRPRAFQRKFDGDFLPWLARYDELYGYGATAAEAGARWEARRSTLAAMPLVLGPACTVRASEFENTTWMAMLAAPGAPGGFVTLARTLGILERLDTASPEERQFLAEHLACMAPTGRPIPGAADVLASEGTLCGDTASPSYGQYQEDSVRLGRRYPLIGWWNEVLTGFCAFWPFPPTGAPHIDGAGVPPVLMVNGDHDPITPIEGAIDAARGFGAARLLVIENESQHTTYGLGNACAEGYMDGYLLTGTLPPPGATCPGLPLPVPPEAAAGAA